MTAARFAREAQGPVDVDRNLNFIRDAGARALNRLRELNDYCEEAANRASVQPLCSSFLLAADDSDASSAAGPDSDSFSASSPVRKRRPKRLSKQRSQQAKSTKQSPSKQPSQSSQLATKSTKDKQSKRQRRSDAVDADRLALKNEPLASASHTSGTLCRKPRLCCAIKDFPTPPSSVRAVNSLRNRHRQTASSSARIATATTLPMRRTIRQLTGPSRASLAKAPPRILFSSRARSRRRIFDEGERRPGASSPSSLCCRGR